MLPYRLDVGDLFRWLEARARGRSLAQIRALGFATRSFEGVQAGARAFGLVSADDELTPAGERLALASDADRRARLAAAAVRYEPYGLLLESVLNRGVPTDTEISWIETWWATHGYGASQTNRAEAAASFGRLVDYLELGSYIPGRRGHPTRIRWSSEAGERVATLAATTAPPPRPARAAPEPAPPMPGLPDPLPRPTAAPRTAPSSASTAPPVRPTPESAVAAQNEIRLDLGGGEAAELRLPTALSGEQKRRLLSLVDLLVRELPGAG